jgi:urease accessory protein
LRAAHQSFDPHAAVTVGAAGASGGLSPRAVAQVAAYASVSGPAFAAVRLLGLDPLRVARLVAALSGAIDRIADEAAAGARRPLTELPAKSAPASDWLAEEHAVRKERLFAS